MPLWLQITFVVTQIIVVPLVGYGIKKVGEMITKLDEHSIKIAQLEAEAASRSNECNSRLTWMREISDKVGTVKEDVAEIKGLLRAGKDSK